MNKFFSKKNELAPLGLRAGFTLIEILMVTGFIALLMVMTIRNFSRSKTFFNESVSILVADIRSAESKAVAGAQYLNSNRCGYGLKCLLSTGSQCTGSGSRTMYKLYAGPVPSVAAPNNYCQAANRNFEDTTGPAVNRDVTIMNKRLFDSRLEFKNNWSDIFFEPVEPKVFINNVYTLNSVQTITIGYIGQNCSVSYPCKSVCVYGSGRVEAVDGSTCPAP